MRRSEEADMDRMRIDHEMTGRDDATPLLDRVWAATRPPELSGDDFDRIWTDVQTAYDARPAVLSMTAAVPGRPRRKVALAVLGLAQLAAAALVAAWVLNRPGAAVAPGPGEDVVKVPPPAVRPAEPTRRPPVALARYDVEADEILIIELGDGPASEERRPGRESSQSLAMLDLPEKTPSDMLGYWETMSR
jgi:hypothetical protein